MRAILRSLSIRQRLFVSSLLYVLPLAVLLYFTVSAIRSDIQFAELEKQGITFVRPLEELMLLVSEHRIIAYLRSQGAVGLESREQEAAKRIDDEFASLLSQSATPFSRFGSDHESLSQAHTGGIQPADIKEAWDKLRSRVNRLTPDATEVEYSKTISTIRRLIARVGDASNLILDPELPSYYLVDTTLVALPQVIEQTGDLSLLGLRARFGASPGAEDLPRLSLLISSLDKAGLQQIQNSLATAVQNDRQVRGDKSSIQKMMARPLQQFLDSTRNLLQAASPGREADKAGVSLEFAKLGLDAADSIGKFKDEAFNQLYLLLQDRIERHRQRMYTTLSLTFFCLALASVLVFIISRGITKPLGKVMSIAREIAAGRIQAASTRVGVLEKEYAGTLLHDSANLSRFRDEIWQLASVFVQMTNSLHSLVTQVQKSGIQVFTSSTEISAASRQIEATAAQQAASTNQVSVTASEISASCRALLESLNRVLEVASRTLSLAHEGQTRLSAMKSTMAELTDASGSIASQLEVISRTTGSIGSVITTMTKVADQTNLLSLNATMEAEKAGKYGLGFSVVAREIQRLADQTAIATLDMENLVVKVSTTVSTGVADMDRFVGQVREAVRDVEAISTELISSIINHLHGLLPRFEELGSAMDAQSAGADEISKAMNQLSEGAEQTRQVIRDFGNVTQQLIRAAAVLQEEVSKFNVDSASDGPPAQRSNP